MTGIYDTMIRQLYFDNWELRSNHNPHNLVLHITIEEMYVDFNVMLEWLCELSSFGDIEIKEIVRHHVLPISYERARAQSRLDHPFSLIKYGYSTMDDTGTETDVGECDDFVVEP